MPVLPASSRARRYISCVRCSVARFCESGRASDLDSICLRVHCRVWRIVPLGTDRCPVSGTISLPEWRKLPVEAFGVSRRCSPLGAAATAPSGWALTMGPTHPTQYMWIFMNTYSDAVPPRQTSHPSTPGAVRGTPDGRPRKGFPMRAVAAGRAGGLALLMQRLTRPSWASPMPSRHTRGMVCSCPGRPR